MNVSRMSCAILVLIPRAATATLRGDEQLQFRRETPVVAVYRRTHQAVVNISGEQMVSQRMWPPVTWLN